MATPEAAKHHDLEQRFRDLERKVRDLTSRALQRPKFAVTEGDLTITGGALVVDGGDFLLLDTDGSTVFRLGPQEYGDRGVSIYREVGTPVLEVSKATAGAVQAWRMKDSDGNVIVAESGFGEGLSRPRIPLRPFPVSTPAWGMYGAEVSTTAGAFTTLFAVQDRRQNPLWAPAFRVKCSDATTAAEVQVVNTATGTPLSVFGGSAWTGTRAAGSTDYVELAPALAMPTSLDHDARFRFEVQVRRTAGAGTVTLAVPESIGA